MGSWRTHTEHWLSSEHRGHDDIAEAAFAEVFAALPAVDPSADFVQRAAHAAWLARGRRRRAIAVASLAASVLVVVLAGAAAYGIFGIAGGWLVTTASVMVANSAVSLIVTVITAVQWWFATALAGSTVVGIMATPQSAVALLSVELVGIAALYMLRRLLRAEVRFGGSRSLCF